MIVEITSVKVDKEQVIIEGTNLETVFTSEDLYEDIRLETCVAKRISAGGTGIASVETQIAFIRSFVSQN